MVSGKGFPGAEYFGRTDRGWSPRGLLRALILKGKGSQLTLSGEDKNIRHSRRLSTSALSCDRKKSSSYARASIKILTNGPKPPMFYKK